MKNLMLSILFTSSLFCFGQEDIIFKNNYAFLTKEDLSKEQIEELVRDFRQHIFIKTETKFNLKFQYSKDGKLELHSNYSIRQEIFSEFFESHNYEISMIESRPNVLTERSSF